LFQLSYVIIQRVPFSIPTSVPNICSRSELNSSKLIRRGVEYI